MLTPFRMGLGGRTGSGQQWLSWIAVQDVIGAMQWILHHDCCSGPFNVVAPNPVTNEEFSTTLASVLSRPAFFWLPGFAVRWAFGEMGKEILLGSQRAEPRKLIASGYIFQQPQLRPALEAILGR
jgi:hypothetical protein